MCLLPNWYSIVCPLLWKYLDGDFFFLQFASAIGCHFLWVVSSCFTSKVLIKSSDMCSLTLLIYIYSNGVENYAWHCHLIPVRRIKDDILTSSCSSHGRHSGKFSLYIVLFSAEKNRYISLGSIVLQSWATSPKIATEIAHPFFNESDFPS
jgi:hypothetical protein